MSRKSKKELSLFKRTKHTLNTTLMVVEDGMDIIGIKTADLKYSAVIDSKVHRIKEDARAEVKVFKAKSKAQKRIAKLQAKLERSSSTVNVEE